MLNITFTITNHIFKGAKLKGVWTLSTCSRKSPTGFFGMSRFYKGLWFDYFGKKDTILFFFDYRETENKSKCNFFLTNSYKKQIPNPRAGKY